MGNKNKALSLEIDFIVTYTCRINKHNVVNRHIRHFFHLFYLTFVRQDQTLIDMIIRNGK